MKLPCSQLYYYELYLNSCTWIPLKRIPCYKKYSILLDTAQVLVLSFSERIVHIISCAELTKTDFQYLKARIEGGVH